MLSGVINTNVNALYALEFSRQPGQRHQLSRTAAVDRPLDQQSGRQPRGLHRGAGLHRAAQRHQPGRRAPARRSRWCRRPTALSPSRSTSCRTSCRSLRRRQTAARPRRNWRPCSRLLLTVGNPGLDDLAADQFQRRRAPASVPGVNFQVGAGARARRSACRWAAPPPTRSVPISRAPTPAPASIIPMASAPARWRITPATPTPCRSYRRVHRGGIDRRFRLGGQRQLLRVGGQRRSALGVAQSINAITSQTNVSAAKDTSVGFTVTAGSFSFTLGNGTGFAQTNAATISATVTSVSQEQASLGWSTRSTAPGTTGVTATVSRAAEHADPDQCPGRQYLGRQFLGHRHIGWRRHDDDDDQLGRRPRTRRPSRASSLQSSGRLRPRGGCLRCRPQHGLGIVGGLLGQCQHGGGCDGGARIVTYALQQLENVGGQLGATQQRLQATVSNLQSANTNLTLAQGVVQDANIPQVTTQLTQQEILQQAGVSALAQSSALQQSFLKLLQG